MLTVSDDQVLAAMRLAFEELRLVVEPGGAVALAALITERGLLAGRTALVILSGGNVDAELFSAMLGEISPDRQA